MERRYFLLGTAAIASGLSGCSTLSSDSQSLDVILFNQTSDPYTVELRMFRDHDDSSRSEARVFSSRLDVDPEGETRRENAAEAEHYVVDYGVYRDNSRLTDQGHVHYSPPNGEDTDTLAFDIRPPGVLTRR
ncbi:hypothetical protein ACFQO4_08550 [Saliphagus sp. GCM10025334]